MVRIGNINNFYSKEEIDNLLLSKMNFQVVDTTAERPVLTIDDAGKWLIWDKQTKDFVSWTGVAWSDEDEP